VSRARTVRGPLIVAIVLTVGIGMGVAGVLWMRAARPVPGPYVDALAIRDGVIAIRAEADGPNGFVERWSDGELRWRGLIPTYDGRPGAIGVRVTAGRVAIRVRRGGQPMSFDLDFARGTKLETGGELTEQSADAAFPAATGALPVGYDAPRHELVSTGGTFYKLPPEAIPPQPYHSDGGVLWIVTPDELTALSIDTLQPVMTIPPPPSPTPTR